MRISKLFTWCGASALRATGFALALPLMALQATAGTTPFVSERDALKQGMSAYQGGYYEIAIPALEFAAVKEAMANYYLARIYADSTSNHTDHAKAYMLLQKVVDELAEVDPDNDPRAPYVGASLTSLARYIRSGLPDIGLAPDLKRAVEYLHNGSVIFDNEDAQFELAKLQLNGEGVDLDENKAKHWLSVLTQKGHAGAQAFLADLLWRGKHMEPDKPRAMALIAIARENAPGNEALWIEDIYQNIYCGAGDGIRKQASGIVAGWGNRYGRKQAARDSDADITFSSGPVRTCQNGEMVNPLTDTLFSSEPMNTGARPASAEGLRPASSSAPSQFSLGGAAGRLSAPTPAGIQPDPDSNPLDTEGPRGDR
jgi:uncharacterized protein